jgi:uncharacterized membrane protein
MTVSVRTAQLLFAICLIGWGFQHLVAGDFISGRAPAWPEALPGKLVFAYLTGLILVMAGIAMIINRKAMAAVMCAGIMILLWAGLRNLHQAITKLDYGFILTNTNKALAIGFGAILVAATYRNGNTVLPKSFLEKVVDRLDPLVKYFIGIFLLISGVQHFIFAQFVKFLVPVWISFPSFWTYFSGIALIVGGLGIITGFHRKQAAIFSAYMIFSWVVVLHIPRALGAEGNANEWTAVFEALATSVLLFIVASREENSTPYKKPNPHSKQTN